MSIVVVGTVAGITEVANYFHNEQSIPLDLFADGAYQGILSTRWGRPAQSGEAESGRPSWVGSHRSKWGREQAGEGGGHDQPEFVDSGKGHLGACREE